MENRIRAIRRFLPKKTALREVYVKRIKEVERSLNYRPIRKFNYNNPIEVLNNNCVELSTNKNIIIHSNTLDLLAAMRQYSMFYTSFYFNSQNLFICGYPFIGNYSIPVQSECKIIGISIRIEIGLHIPWHIFKLLFYRGHICRHLKG